MFCRTRAACLQGQAAKVQWLPDLKMMGEGTPFDVLTSVLSVVSVACLAFTCEARAGLETGPLHCVVPCPILHAAPSAWPA